MQLGQRCGRPGASPFCLPPLSRSATTASSAASTSQQATTGLVYHTSCPLEGPPWEQLAAVLGPRFPPQLALHRMVVLEDASTRSLLVFDFLPAEPSTPATVAALLTGGSVTGRPCELPGSAHCWLSVASRRRGVSRPLHLLLALQE